ncbi:MAG: acetyl/propionyl/methylcrotonyl-CoA carboxylase subunit alpha [Alphaproteobacteria bacterium]|nr:acetyl/propionyl/methylcrotonyl-CoA carboxylase subunit alpha [Alphaproteobacteria bacterium]
MTPPFKKILIANRGEIACRVIRTAKRLGIGTVAVYSDADADALHVREADEAVRIGPPPSAQSYLNIEAIVAACKQTGAEAVHPGYGFLSERAPFCEALKTAGIVFIGPEPHAIQAMGDKIESKKLAQAARVSTVPGHLEAIPDAEEAVEIAKKVGFPVMIKASAGGGGKGMRIARSDAEVREGFQSATNEAKSSFGDDRVFIERYVEEPRHIEIQVIGDAHGTVVYLGERECSVQRRHQKVLEEAPSPFLDAKTRKAMGEQAVALAKAVKYRSAGTVEFIVDKDRNFYFLEMNTRLQVEHPVTELVTGLDLVELMIRVAAGEKLPLAQKDVALEGWAMEARIYAEDPRRGFLPAIGRLTRYRPPQGDGIRVDTGVYEGAEISMHYDPMIAKLVTSGATREEAIDRALAALDRYEIEGVGHNLDFLAALLALPRFREGRLTTNLIAEEYPKGFKGAPASDANRHLLAALAAAFQRRLAERDAMIDGQLPGRRTTVAIDWVVRLAVEGSDPIDLPVAVQPAEHGYDVAVAGHVVALRGEFAPGTLLFDGTANGEACAARIRRHGISWRIARDGRQAEAQVVPPQAARYLALMPKKAAPDLSRFLLSPMPGLLVSVAVKPGQEVKAGEPLAVVEAMKMENVLKAPQDGKVAIVHANAGDSLAVDQKILEFA